MEDQSIRIVRDLLPEQWVVREYRPDYGIDLAIELFEYLDVEQTVAATLGETLFVQVKSTDIVRRRTVRLYGRSNVEKGPVEEDRSDYRDIEVVHLQIATSELLTVQAMGAAIPVLLFLVELSTRRIYFVCLNDLVEKVILPQNPAFSEQLTKTILIPARNSISARNPVSVSPLGTLAKRPKLYAAFEKFGYQQHELEFKISPVISAATTQRVREALTELNALVRHFLAVDLRYDFWTRMPEWKPIEWSFWEISQLAGFLAGDLLDDCDALRRYLATSLFSFEELSPAYLNGLELPDLQRTLAMRIQLIWGRLSNLSRIYEELAREWFLPTYLSHALTEELDPH